MSVCHTETMAAAAWTPAATAAMRDQRHRAAQPSAAQALTKETTMNPIIHRNLKRALITDLHRQAHRDARARTASQAHRVWTAQHRHPVRRLPVAVARRVRTALGGTP